MLSPCHSMSVRKEGEKNDNDVKMTFNNHKYDNSDNAQRTINRSNDHRKGKEVDNKTQKNTIVVKESNNDENVGTNSNSSNSSSDKEDASSSMSLACRFT